MPPCPIERVSPVPSRSEWEGTALWGRAVAAARPGTEGSLSSGGGPGGCGRSGGARRFTRGGVGREPLSPQPSRAERTGARRRLPRAGRASVSVRRELAQRREPGRAVCWAQGEQEEGAGPARGLCGGGCCRGKTPVRVRSPLDRGFASPRPTGAG